MSAELAQWFAAARAGDEQRILTSMGTFAGSKTDTGETALMIATYNDHARIVSRLCPYEARCSDNSGKAAIHIAVERDNYDTCTALGPHERGILIENGMNPYHLAARLGKARAMDALAIFFGMERDYDGLSVLEHAVIGESEECLKYALNNRKVTAKDIANAKAYAEDHALSSRMIRILDEKLGEYGDVSVSSMVGANLSQRYTSSTRSQLQSEQASVTFPDEGSLRAADDCVQEMRQITGSFRCVPLNSRSEDHERIDELLAAKDELLREHMAERLSPTARSRSVSPPVSPKSGRIPNFSTEAQDTFTGATVLPTSPLGVNSFCSPPLAREDDTDDAVDDIIDALSNVSRQTKMNEDLGVPLPRREPPQIVHAPLEPLEKLTGSFTATAFADESVKHTPEIRRLPPDNYEYKDYPQYSRTIDMNKKHKDSPCDAINKGLEKLTASQRIADKGLTSSTAVLISEYDPRTSQYKAVIDRANEIIRSSTDPVGPYAHQAQQQSKNKAVRKAVAVLENDALPSMEEIQRATKTSSTMSAIVPPLATTIPDDEGRRLTSSFIGGQPLMDTAPDLRSSIRFRDSALQDPVARTQCPLPVVEDTISVEDLIASHKQNHPQDKSVPGRFTSLMKAAVENDISAAKMLVVSFARAQDPNGKTALMYAAERGHEEIANLLLPFEGGMQLKNGGTALMHALGNGHLNVAAMLMSCDGGLAMDDGWTALMSAATINADNIVVGLLDKEAGMVCNDKHKEGEGYCACMIAAKKNNLASLRLLAPREGQITNFMGQNALSFAKTSEVRELLSLFH